MARKVSASNFAAFLKQRLKARDGYIFGATGQNPRKLPDRYFSGQYRGRQLKQALYWRAHAQRVWDCNGLAEGYYKQVTGSSINARARDNYSDWCSPKGKGKIPAKYRVPGAAVFMRSSYIHHVGFLVEPVNKKKPEGDWYVIEARGVMTGVVRTRLSKRSWNRWGWMTRYFKYDAPASEPAGEGKALKLGSRGAKVRKLQAALIALGLAPEGAKPNGVYGESTAAAVRRLQARLGLKESGVYDEATHAALKRALKREKT